MIVYMATNTKNSKVYICLTTKKLKYRILLHKYNARAGMAAFYTAIRKYGWHNFTWQIIDRCDTITEMYESKEYFIKLYNSTDRKFGYNCTTGGLSYTMIPETKKKMSDNSPRLCGENHAMYNRHHTKEAKEKQRQWSAQRKHSPETIEKMKGENNPMFGKHRTEKEKEKIRKGLKKYMLKKYPPQPLVVVYKITNKTNGKVFVGITTQGIRIAINLAKHRHKQGLSNSPISLAMKKYGFLSFSWEILKICKDRTELLHYQKQIIKDYKSDDSHYGYNNAWIGENHPMYNRKHSEKSKQKMRESRLKYLLKGK